MSTSVKKLERETSQSYVVWDSSDDTSPFSQSLLNVGQESALKKNEIPKIKLKSNHSDVEELLHTLSTEKVEVDKFSSKGISPFEIAD